MSGCACPLQRVKAFPGTAGSIVGISFTVTAKSPDLHPSLSAATNTASPAAETVTDKFDASGVKDAFGFAEEIVSGPLPAACNTKGAPLQGTTPEPRLKEGRGLIFISAETGQFFLSS